MTQKATIIKYRQFLDFIVFIAPHCKQMEQKYKNMVKEGTSEKVGRTIFFYTKLLQF